MTEHLTHSDARLVLAVAWTSVHQREPTDAELTYAQAIAYFETGYGRIGQFAEKAREGVYNWGALQVSPRADGTCPPGTFLGKDGSHSRCFLAFESDADAAAAYLRVLTAKGGALKARCEKTLAALATGDAKIIAHAMKTPPAYYEAPEVEYARAIERAAQAVRRALGKSPSSPTFPSAADAENTRAVQEALNAEEHGTPLVVDGIAGPRTRETIARFEAHHSLGVSGVVTPLLTMTLAKLLRERARKLLELAKRLDPSEDA